MTKTEYAQYLASEHWLERRKQAIELAHHECERCELPRWVASLIYDQDLHVHHLNYQNRGNEQPEDLEVLCRRCHEIETFGRSGYKEIKKAECLACGMPHWDIYSDYCEFCAHLRYTNFYGHFDLKCDPEFCDDRLVWQIMLQSLTFFLLNSGASVQQQAFEIFISAIKSRGVFEYRKAHEPEDDSDVPF